MLYAFSAQDDKSGSKKNRPKKPIAFGPCGRPIFFLPPFPSPMCGAARPPLMDGPPMILPFYQPIFGPPNLFSRLALRTPRRPAASADSHPAPIPAVQGLHFLSVYFFSVYTRSTPVDTPHGPRDLGIFGGGNANHSPSPRNNEGLLSRASKSEWFFLA